MTLIFDYDVDDWKSISFANWSIKCLNSQWFMTRTKDNKIWNLKTCVLAIDCNTIPATNHSFSIDSPVSAQNISIFSHFSIYYFMIRFHWRLTFTTLIFYSNVTRHRCKCFMCELVLVSLSHWHSCVHILFTGFSSAAYSIVNPFYIISVSYTYVYIERQGTKVIPNLRSYDKMRMVRSFKRKMLRMRSNILILQLHIHRQATMCFYALQAKIISGISTGRAIGNFILLHFCW